MLRRSQSGRLDDQRGVISQESELPDFLKLPNVNGGNTLKKDSTWRRHRAESSLSESSPLNTIKKKKGSCVELSTPIQHSTLDRNCISTNNINNTYISPPSKITLLSKSDSTLTRKTSYSSGYLCASNDPNHKGDLSPVVGRMSTLSCDSILERSMDSSNCTLDDESGIENCTKGDDTTGRRRKDDLDSFGLIAYDLSPRSMERRKISDQQMDETWSLCEDGRGEDLVSSQKTLLNDEPIKNEERSTFV